MMTEGEYDKILEELEEKLKPLLTDMFLDTLVKSAKTCGWSVDHIETENFVRWCFDIAGKKIDQDLNPYLEP